jgi:hypothetical protein
MTIAFCFLVYNHITRYDIWNNFFKNINYDKYIVFIHPKNNFSKITANSNSNINDNVYTFNYKIVNNIINTISKDHISIVKATIQLFKETYMYNDKITHYIFLSQSCIPIYNFDIIYKIIIEFNNSVISSINNNKKERYYQLDRYISKCIKYIDFIKQQPNMILIKNDIIDLLNNNFILNFSNMQCPDEHYFINVLTNILKKKIIKHQINFCNYDLNKTQAIEFNMVNISLIDKIRKHGFLFMRKVNKKSIINSYYLFM